MITYISAECVRLDAIEKDPVMKNPQYRINAAIFKVQTGRTLDTWLETDQIFDIFHPFRQHVKDFVERVRDKVTNDLWRKAFTSCYQTQEMLLAVYGAWEHNNSHTPEFIPPMDKWREARNDVMRLESRVAEVEGGKEPIKDTREPQTRNYV